MGLKRPSKEWKMEVLCIAKKIWSKLVWGKIWQYEDSIWQDEIVSTNYLNIVSKIIDGPAYLSWWQLADQSIMDFDL